MWIDRRCEIASHGRQYRLAVVPRSTTPDADSGACGLGRSSRVSHDLAASESMQLPLLSHKAARFAESVIRGMSVEAARHNAVNLAQGMPDFPAPLEVKAAACRAIEADINQYAITWGSKRLREAIAEHAEWHLGLSVDPDTEITVTCGSTEAMLVALLSTINPGDEVILSQPFYENYWPDCVLAGAVPRFAPLRPPHWRFDRDELADVFNDRTKAIILCNPNNPTGTVFDREDLEAIAELCLKWDVIAITDEIYEHIIFDGRRHIALATLDGMRERSVTISGMSKTYAVTGWRVGTILAPPRLTHAFRQIHDYVSIGAAAPLQEAGAVAYRLPRDYYARLAADYQARRDKLCLALVDVGFDLELPQGAYYVMTDITAFAATDDVAFAKHLVRHIGVATVPGSSFFHDKALGGSYIRFCFCKRDETLDLAIERLRKLRVIV
jgi:aminotransferase